jgi:hypothetical protein
MLAPVPTVFVNRNSSSGARGMNKPTFLDINSHVLNVLAIVAEEH